MKHSREDYQDRIVDLENKIPEDEPVFVLRGQDALAGPTMEFYAGLARTRGASREFVRSVDDHIERVKAWEPKKMPDLQGPRTETETAEPEGGGQQ